MEGGGGSQKRAWAGHALAASKAVCSSKRSGKRSANVEAIVHTGLLFMRTGDAHRAASQFEKARKELGGTRRGPRARRRAEVELLGLLGVCDLLEAERGGASPVVRAQRLAAAVAKLEQAAGEGAEEGAAACWLNCAGLAQLVQGHAAGATVLFTRAEQAATQPQDRDDARSNRALAGLTGGGGAEAAVAALRAAVAAAPAHAATRLNLSAAMACGACGGDAEELLPPASADGATGSADAGASALLLNNVGVAQLAEHRTEAAASTLRRAVGAADAPCPPDLHFNHALARAHRPQPQPQPHAAAASAPADAPAAAAAGAELPTLEQMVDAPYQSPPLFGSGAASAVRKKAAEGTAYRALANATATAPRGIPTEAVVGDPAPPFLSVPDRS